MSVLMVQRDSTHRFYDIWAFFENPTVYDTTRKYMVQTDRPQMTMLCMWIIKATNTHSEYVILTTFYSNNAYTNAPQCYVYICTVCLVLRTIQVSSDTVQSPIQWISESRGSTGNGVTLNSSLQKVSMLRIRRAHLHHPLTPPRSLNDATHKRVQWLLRL
jgi:hypothetical protein